MVHALTLFGSPLYGTSIVGPSSPLVLSEGLDPQKPEDPPTHVGSSSLSFPRPRTRGRFCAPHRCERNQRLLAFMEPSRNGVFSPARRWRTRRRTRPSSATSGLGKGPLTCTTGSVYIYIYIFFIYIYIAGLRRDIHAQMAEKAARSAGLPTLVAEPGSPGSTRCFS